MIGKHNIEDRDEVLFAFHQAYEQPTAEQIVEWIGRYPQFADDIRDHATVAWDWVAQKEPLPYNALDEAMSARCYSQALNLIYDSESKPQSAADAAGSKTFQDMQVTAGKEVYQIAGELDVGRTIIADLFNGWMLPPIRKRLIDGLLNLLAISMEEFEEALNTTLQHPRLGHAKADRAPTVVPRPCDEIIRASNMSPERKSYWLEED
jgi:hypothetical protein